MPHRLMGMVREHIHAKYIAAFLLCLILPLTVLGAFFSYRMQHLLTESERANTSAKIEASMAQLEQTLQNMNDILSALVINYSVSDLLRSVQPVPTYDWFQEYKSFENLLQTVSARGNRSYRVTVISATGKVYHSGASYNTFLTLSDPLCKAVLDAGGDTLTLSYAPSGYDERGLLTVGKALFEKGALLGVVLVDTPMAMLDEIFSIFEREDTCVYVYSNAGQRLYARLPAGGEGPDEAALLDLPATGADSIRVGRTDYLAIENLSESSGMSILVLVSKALIFRASNALMLQVVAGLVLTLLTAIAAIVLLTLHMTRNINRLGRAVACFGREEKEIALPMRRNSRDELGQLVRGVEAMSRRILRLLETVRADEHTKWELEFQALQAQINPHMIYNTLNTITNLARLQNVPSIEAVSTAFVHLLRTVSNRNEEYVSIQDELDCVQAFVTLKQYNHPWNIACVIEAQPEARDCRILKLLLQPLVENALVHGFTGKRPNGEIRVSVVQREANIEIEINDNGEGMDAQTLQNILSDRMARREGFSNVGIFNTWRRLELKYGEAASFDIQSRVMGGTRVRIVYPAEAAARKEASA